MKPSETTVEQLLRYCLETMSIEDTDTLELDLQSDDTVLTFELKLTKINGKSAVEIEE